MDPNEHLPSYRRNPLGWVADLCATLDLNPGVDTRVTLERTHRPSYGPHRRVDHVTLEVDWKALQPTARRNIKLYCKGLEVPSWALGGAYKEPPLHGEVVYGEADSGTLTVSFEVNGAYVCEKVGEQEQPPAQWQEAEADKLAALTPEEIMAQHQARIEELRTPTLKPSYRCKPVK